MTPDRGSGEDPMAEDPTAVDTAHAMKTATRYEQHQDALERGRFGREVRPAPAADVSMADARTTMQTDRADGRFLRAGYEIDAHAVADAIVDRLLAGRTLAPLRTDDR
jgi:hypothetical protein